MLDGGRTGALRATRFIGVPPGRKGTASATGRDFKVAENWTRDC